MAQTPKLGNANSVKRGKIAHIYAKPSMRDRGPDRLADWLRVARSPTRGETGIPPVRVNTTQVSYIGGGPRGLCRSIGRTHEQVNLRPPDGPREGGDGRIDEGAKAAGRAESDRGLYPAGVGRACHLVHPNQWNGPGQADNREKN
jgi:hypothetical protein